MLSFSVMVSLLAQLTVLAALFLLWHRRRSPWLIVSFVGELASLALHLLSTLVPTPMTTFHGLLWAWSLAGIVMPIGLLGYAIDDTTRKNAP